MRLHNHHAFGIWTTTLLFLASAAMADIPVQLTCEYRTNPFGIDIPQPQLSWQISSTTRGQKQSAYQILVASSPALLSSDNGDMWSSGKVSGDQSVYVKYAGSALQAGKRYYWKVKIWDKDGTATAWSDPAMWCMGRLSLSDWKGSWVSGSGSLSKNISITKPIKNAAVFMSGLPCSELYINGTKAGRAVAGPGITAFPKRFFYVVEDVTNHLSIGATTIRVDLSTACQGYTTTGYVGSPKLLLDLEIEYTDGTFQTFSSDNTWAGVGQSVSAPTGVFCARPIPPLIDTAGGTHLDLRTTGSFTTSNSFFNTLQTTVRTSIFNHAGDFWIDGTREPVGWTQNAQGFGETVICNADVGAFYRKWWFDMYDRQAADGSVPEVCPQIYGLDPEGWNSPWWGGCIVWIPWTLYQYYGDIRFLRESYDAMKAYVNYLDLKAGTSHMVTWFGLGDWHADYFVAAQLINTLAFYHYAKVVSATAKLLGKSTDAQTYAALAAAIRTSFNAKYFKNVTGRVDDWGSVQGSQALALRIGMVPDGMRDSAQKALVSIVHADSDHPRFGFVTGPYVLQALIEAGQADLLYTMVNQQTFPSWKTNLNGNNGEFGEGWDGGGNTMPGLAGCVGLYFFQGLGGIRPDTAAPGFKRAIISPLVVPQLSYTNCSYTSPYGTFVSNWKLSNGGLAMDVTIPANTVASLCVPTDNVASVQESGQPAGSAEGVTYMGARTQRAVYLVQSGVYHFTAHFGQLADVIDRGNSLRMPGPAIALNGNRWTANAGSPYRMEVYSASGKSAYSAHGQGPASGYIPINQLPRGLYVVNMRQEGKKLTRRITAPFLATP